MHGHQFSNDPCVLSAIGQRRKSELRHISANSIFKTAPKDQQKLKKKREGKRRKHNLSSVYYNRTQLILTCVVSLSKENIVKIKALGVKYLHFSRRSSLRDFLHAFFRHDDESLCDGVDSTKCGTLHESFVAK